MRTTQKTSKKPLFITLIVIAGLALAYFVTAYATQSLWPFQEVKKSATSENTNADTDISPVPEPNSNDGTNQEIPGGDTPTSNDPADHTPPKFETPEGDEKPSGLTGIISFSAVKDNKLMIRTTINQHLASGSCELSLVRSSDGKIVSRQADITPDPSTSACKGFDIPTKELGAGHWSITIKLKSGDQQGKLTGEVNL